MATLILGESLALALVGGAIGIALTFPVAVAFVHATGTLFPVFHVSQATVGLQVVCAIVVGIVAALLPMRRAIRLRIVEGLRSIG